VEAVDVVDEELVDSLEVDVDGVGAAAADAGGSEAEPEEPPPHDAHASAAKIAITVFIATRPISMSRRPIMHVACPQAGP